MKLSEVIESLTGCQDIVHSQDRTLSIEKVSGPQGATLVFKKKERVGASQVTKSWQLDEKFWTAEWSDPKSKIKPQEIGMKTANTPGRKKGGG